MAFWAAANDGSVESQLLDVEFKGYLEIAGDLMRRMKLTEDRTVADRFIRDCLIMSESCQVSVKIHRNRFMRYLLKVMKRTVETQSPVYVNVPVVDGRSARIGTDQAIVKWSSDNRSYVAAKVIAGFGTLIYMAVTSVPFGWDEEGSAKLIWAKAKAEVPNDKDVTEFMVPPIDGWTREMSNKYGAIHFQHLEDQKSPKKSKRRPKGTTAPKSSLRKRNAHFDYTLVSVMDLPVPDQDLPNLELKPRINTPLQRNEAFNINFKPKKQANEDPGNLIRFNTPALPSASAGQQVEPAVEPAQLTIPPSTSPIISTTPSLDVSTNASSIL